MVRSFAFTNFSASNHSLLSNSQQSPNLNEEQRTKLSTILKSPPSEKRDEQLLEDFLDSILDPIFHTIVSAGPEKPDKNILLLLEDLKQIGQYFEKKEHDYGFYMSDIYAIEILCDPHRVCEIVQECLEMISILPTPKLRYDIFGYFQKSFETVVYKKNTSLTLCNQFKEATEKMILFAEHERKSCSDPIKG